MLVLGRVMLVLGRVMLKEKILFKKIAEGDFFATTRRMIKKNPSPKGMDFFWN